MFRFPCGFSTTHSESLNLRTATQLCYNIHPDTSMHVIIILITTYAITQQAHSCSTGLRRNGSTATRPPQCWGWWVPSHWPKAIHHRRLVPAGDWKRAQSKCHVDNVDSISNSTCYSISRMCLHLIHHQLSRRWEHHRSWKKAESFEGHKLWTKMVMRLMEH